ncbi:MAG: prepilin-type N-terminal cleavage/methylation domain-containing protein [Planctomycetaceae bacterium]|nr:prepilin-type N-terminal cleavage/methylation domain-containing protein [Planctomycetaceae bacterium]
MKKGFTLVELLVVIAIIAILVAILVPVIGTVLNDAREGACQTNLKTVGGAFSEYKRARESFARISGHASGDPAATYAPGGTSDTLASVAAAPMNEVWALIQAGYLPETAFRCPGDKDWLARVMDATTLRFGWSANTQFSYGIQFPYDSNLTPTTSLGNPSLALGAANAYSANGVLMADMPKRGAANPVVTAFSDYQNHREGVALVTLVGNALLYEPETANSLINGDEIYKSSGADAASACPGSATDAVICPGAIP